MLLKYIKGRNKKKERSPLQVNKNNQITVEELIKEFKNILDNYGDLNKKSCLPWFFGGRPGQTGKDRLKLAEELPFLRPENNMYTANRKEVLKQICQFYHDETNKSIWASRLLDPIGDLIDKALGISYSPVGVTNATKARRAVEKYDKQRREKIEEAIKSDDLCEARYH